MTFLIVNKIPICTPTGSYLGEMIYNYLYKKIYELLMYPNDNLDTICAGCAGINRRNLNISKNVPTNNICSYDNNDVPTK